LGFTSFNPTYAVADVMTKPQRGDFAFKHYLPVRSFSQYF